MASTLFDLTGKVALITGSSKGIGRAIAEEMARHGAQVVISSRKADVCQEVADAINQELADEAGGATVIPAHIGRKEDLQELVDKTRAALGKIDILVCNAAVNPYYGSMRDLPDEAFDKILGINIKSNHWLANMVLPEMIERKDGSIIIVSSVGGMKGSPLLGAYCISKAADVQMVRNLAVEYGQHNIRVNSISLVWCVPISRGHFGKIRRFCRRGPKAIRCNALERRVKLLELRCVGIGCRFFLLLGKISS